MEQLCIAYFSEYKRVSNRFENVHCVIGTSYFCVQLVFEGVRGSSYRGDIAIDDIQLKDGPCPASSGQYTL